LVEGEMFTPREIQTWIVQISVLSPHLVQSVCEQCFHKQQFILVALFMWMVPECMPHITNRWVYSSLASVLSGCVLWTITV